MNISINANPSTLRIGHTGVLDGRRWTVLGRLALRSDDGYAWQEFYLGTQQGDTCTLVYEDKDWKLFRELEPANPITASEAAKYRVGDNVVVNGIKAEVDYVGGSRVTHLEGQAPPGVEVGDRARYFNAQQGSGMLVVSWTGGEAECFSGRDLPFNSVESAFGLPKRSQWARMGLSGLSWRSIDPNYLAGGAFVLAIVLVLAAYIYDELAVPTPPAPPAKVEASPTRLPAQATGGVRGHTYTVRGHAIVEIARPGGKFDRHEYVLIDETGAPALLVQGISAHSTEWSLLTPVRLPEDFTPYEAARVRAGKTTTADGQSGQVVYLFQSKSRVTEKATDLRPWADEVQYGFLMRTPDHWLLVRWTEKELQAYRGRPVGSKEIAAAFKIPEEALSRP